MCVRTKTSYGCGHSSKVTNDCGKSRCKGLERFHLEKEGDCSSCRAAGATISRGKDGKGRYAREHKLNQSKGHGQREPLSEVPNKAAERRSVRDPSPVPENTSPWVPAEPVEGEEKLWNTRPRRKADDAWLREHAERQSVSARATPERDSDVENTEFRRQSSRCNSEEKDESESRLHREIRKIQDAEHRSEARRRERQDSYDSFPSLESGGNRSFRSRHRKHRERSYHEPYDSPASRYEYREPYSHSRSPYNFGMYSTSPGPYEPSYIEVRPLEQYQYGVSPTTYVYGTTPPTSYYSSGFGMGTPSRRRRTYH